MPLIRGYLAGLDGRDSLGSLLYLCSVRISDCNRWFSLPYQSLQQHESARFSCYAAKLIKEESMENLDFGYPESGRTLAEWA